MLQLNALIAGYETVGDHTEYIIQINCQMGSWMISRRFSDFDHLHSRLNRRFGDLIDAKLPEKQWFGRFDSQFLAKRQDKLQQYLVKLLNVPGILDDISLCRFLDVEKHLDPNGELVMGLGARTSGGGNTNRSSGFPGSRNGIITEQDRLNAIVDHAAQAFIDINQVTEPLEEEQARQRRSEIFNIAHMSCNEQKIADHFASTMQNFAVCLPSVDNILSEAKLLSYFEASDDTTLSENPAEQRVELLSFDQQRELIQICSTQVEAAVKIKLDAPTVDLVVVIDTLTLPSESSDANRNTNVAAAARSSATQSNGRMSNPSEETTD
uniref:Uncharacterized protein AlNc14C16G1743 n=1 Tax=Albugo laibachii Nc14 TaxID=890382 RepID=F0W460_9STRA|nr:conserved hypothetical protein [Albugo laibachii Nc14]|eukprot:CCA15858.1 conserved hypothetical protein [Albugo laibachii Nc14]